MPPPCQDVVVAEAAAAVLPHAAVDLPGHRYHLGVAAQLEIESKIEAELKTVEFIFVSSSYSRRFQFGFHRVNLHRPTAVTSDEKKATPVTIMTSVKAWCSVLLGSTSPYPTQGPYTRSYFRST